MNQISLLQQTLKPLLDERMDLLDRFQEIFPEVRVAFLSAEREFVGKEWLSYLLLQPTIWFPSSKTCHVCLNRVDNLSLDVRAWTCKHYGTHHDRDVNAAINIKNKALRILRLDSVRVFALGTSVSACGGGVSRSDKTKYEASRGDKEARS